MKKLSLLLLLVCGFVLRSYGQTNAPSHSLGEMLLSDDALISHVEQVNAYAVEDALNQLKYHLSYVIGDRAATVPDFRKIFFSSQCKLAMTTIAQEFDQSGLTAELLRIAPDFLASYTFDQAFADKLAESLAPYHLTKVQIDAALPALMEAQARYQSTLHLPAAAHLSEGILPLLEKCMNADNSEAAQNEEGPVVHPFTIGAHASGQGYSAGGALTAYSLMAMVEAAKNKNAEQIAQATATLMAVWVSLPDGLSF